MPLTRIKSTAIGDNTITDSKITGGGIAPTGTILPYSSETAPTGWFICDGRTVSRTTYSDLFAVLSTNWGYGDNSTTFNIPDLRGRFLRGHDDGNGNDPDAASRTASNTGGATGDNVGSVQGDSFQYHAHKGRFAFNGTPSFGNSYGLSYALASAYTQNFYITLFESEENGNWGSDPNISSTGTSTSAKTSTDETRPINANVNYIIKF